MKRTLILTLACAATLLGVSSRSQAESQSRITRAVVPFTFAVGREIFPPGTYDIARNGAFVSFRSGNGRSGTFLAPMHGSASKDARSRLFFDFTNHCYFLRKIVTPSDVSSMDFPKSGLQKQAEESADHVSLPIATNH